MWIVLIVRILYNNYIEGHLFKGRQVMIKIKNMVHKPSTHFITGLVGGSISGKISRGTRILPIVLSLLFFAAAGSAYYFYTQGQELKQNPQKAAQEEAQALVERIGRLIVLPADETPTIATVSDPERLKDQTFFAKAVKGDKVLIYTNAKKAILYSPSTDKIVEVAPVNIGAGADQQTPVVEEQPAAEE